MFESPANAAFLTIAISLKAEMAQEIANQFMLNIGTTVLPWEPYTGGIASPNPEYPQEIVNTGKEGSVDVTVCGINIFGRWRKTETQEWNQAVTEILVWIETNILMQAGITYYIAFYKDGEFITGSNGECYANTTDSSAGAIDARSGRFTAIKTGPFFFRVGDSNNSAIYDNFEISLSPIAQYSPYTAQQVAVPTPDGLPGIPVSSGGTWTDENGQAWVSDVVDLAAQEKTQRIFKGSLNALSGWAVSSDGLRIFARLTGLGVQEAVSTPVISNYFKGGSWTLQQAGTIAVGNGSAGSTVSVSTGDFPTVADLENWLSSHTCVFYTLLKNPATTPLDDATITAYKALQSYPGTTNIIAPDAGIEAAAVAEPNQYIEDRIQAAITQAVTQAVALTGGNT